MTASKSRRSSVRTKTGQSTNFVSTSMPARRNSSWMMRARSIVCWCPDGMVHSNTNRLPASFSSQPSSLRSFQPASARSRIASARSYGQGWTSGGYWGDWDQNGPVATFPML